MGGEYGTFYQYNRDKKLVYQKLKLGFVCILALTDRKGKHVSFPERMVRQLLKFVSNTKAKIINYHADTT